MARRIDWELERARAASHTQVSLVRLARDAGYEVSQGKGSHLVASRPGLGRPVVIQNKIWRVVALSIIDALREGAR